MVKRNIRTVIGALIVGYTLVAAAPVPKHGGTFVYAISGDPGTLNPALTTGVEALTVDCKMFNGLLW